MKPPGSRLRRNEELCWQLAAGFVFLLVAFWSTGPLIGQATSTVPLSTMRVGTVPLLNIWTIWWNADRLSHGLAGYWSAPIFYPVRDAFAYSEPQPMTLLVAPVLNLTGSRTLAYNVYLWLSLTLNGVATCLLLRHRRASRCVSLAGGMLMLLLPVVHWQLEVIQLVPVWAILWCWWELDLLGRRPCLAGGARLGLAFAATFWISGHQALLLSIPLALCGGLLICHWRASSTWKALGMAALTGVCLTGPLIWQLQQSLKVASFARDHEVVTMLSAVPGDYLLCSGWSVWNHVDDRTARLLNPGWIKVCLAIIGMVVGLQRRQWRRWTLFLILMSTLSFCLSLGPHLTLLGWSPWWSLSEIWPGLSRVRSVHRFAWFVQIAAVLLAAQASQAFWLLGRHPRIRRIAPAGLVRLLTCVVLCIAMIEVLPAPVVLLGTPDATRQQDWIQAVRTHTRSDEPILCLPFSTGGIADGFEGEARWMYYGTFHGRPLLNGYSGFFPDDYFTLQAQLTGPVPSSDGLQRLNALGVSVLVINRNVVDFPDQSDVDVGPWRLSRVFQGTTQVDLYRLRSLRRPH